MKEFSKGNVLFIILIAVALYAALSTVITQSSNTKTKSSTGEQIDLKVNELLDFAQKVKAGVHYIYTENELSETQIRFAHPELNSAYGDPSALPAAQMVFHPSGGGITYAPIPPILMDTSQSSATGYGEYYITGGARIIDVGTNITTDALAQELMLIVPYISEEACKKINKKLAPEITAIPQDSANFTFSTQFSGTFTNSYGLGDEVALINYDKIIGQKALCIESVALSNTYHFYQVLLER